MEIPRVLFLPRQVVHFYILMFLHYLGLIHMIVLLEVMLKMVWLLHFLFKIILHIQVLLWKHSVI